MQTCHDVWSERPWEPEPELLAKLQPSLLASWPPSSAPRSSPLGPSGATVVPPAASLGCPVSALWAPAGGPALLGQPPLSGWASPALGAACLVPSCPLGSIPLALPGPGAGSARAPSMATRRRPCSSWTIAWLATWRRCGSWSGRMRSWRAASASGTSLRPRTSALTTSATSRPLRSSSRRYLGPGPTPAQPPRPWERSVSSHCRWGCSSQRISLPLGPAFLSRGLVSWGTQTSLCL